MLSDFQKEKIKNLEQLKKSLLYGLHSLLSVKTG